MAVSLREISAVLVLPALVRVIDAIRHLLSVPSPMADFRFSAIAVPFALNERNSVNAASLPVVFFKPLTMAAGVAVVVVLAVAFWLFNAKLAIADEVIFAMAAPVAASNRFAIAPRVHFTIPLFTHNNALLVIRAPLDVVTRVVSVANSNVSQSSIIPFDLAFVRALCFFARVNPFAPGIGDFTRVHVFELAAMVNVALSGLAVVDNDASGPEPSAILAHGVAFLARSAVDVFADIGDHALGPGVGAITVDFAVLVVAAFGGLAGVVNSAVGIGLCSRGHGRVVCGRSGVIPEASLGRGALESFALVVDDAHGQLLSGDGGGVTLHFAVGTGSALVVRADIGNHANGPGAACAILFKFAVTVVAAPHGFAGVSAADRLIEVHRRVGVHGRVRPNANIRSGALGGLALVDKDANSLFHIVCGPADLAFMTGAAFDASAFVRVLANTVLRSRLLVNHANLTKGIALQVSAGVGELGHADRGGDGGNGVPGCFANLTSGALEVGARIRVLALSHKPGSRIDINADVGGSAPVVLAGRIASGIVRVLGAGLAVGLGDRELHFVGGAVRLDESLNADLPCSAGQSVLGGAVPRGPDTAFPDVVFGGAHGVDGVLVAF